MSFTLFPFLLTALFAPAAVPAAPAAPMTGRISAILDQIQHDENSMRAALGLWQLPDLYGFADASSRKRISETLERLSKNPRTPLPVRRLATRMLGERLRAAGEDHRAVEAWSRLGVLRDWWIIGPFDNEGHAGFDTQYPPEEKIDLDAVVPGKSRQVSWRLAPVRPEDGRMMLHPLFSPHEAVVAYALTVLEVPKPSPVLLWAGCDDACQVWIDGKKVLEDAGLHPLRDDQQAVAFILGKGQHRLLVKSVQEQSAWGFTLSLTDPEGRPPSQIQTVSVREALQKALAAPMPRPWEKLEAHQTLSSWFDDQAQRRPDDAHALAEAGFAMSQTAASDSRERRAEQLLQKAIAQLDPSDPAGFDFRLWLARLTEDENLSRSLLEEAVSRFPGRPEAWGRLGLLRHIRAETDKSLEYHLQALAAEPGYLPSLLELAELFAELNLSGLAVARLEELLSRHPDLPEVLSVAAMLRRRMNHAAAAEELLHRLLAIADDDQMALRALHEIAAARGDLDQALSWLDRLLKLDPLRTSWWQERGDLLLHNGHAADALSSYHRAVEICPEDPASLVKEGNALMALGRVPETIERWHRALAISPQDQNLERHIRSLQPKGEEYYRPWMADAAALLKREAAPAANEESIGATQVLDLTVVRLHPNNMVSRFRQEVRRVHNRLGAKSQRTFRIEYAPGRQEVRVLQSRVLRADGSIDSSATTEDFSLSEPWYNLYYDVHVREVTFPTLSPGDGIELSYLVNDVGDANLLGQYFGDLVPLQSELPTRRAAYVLLTPPGRPLFFNEPAGISHQVQTAPDGTKIHTWEALQLPAVEPEPAMPGFTETNTTLHVSTFNDWAELGKWFFALIADQLNPGPEVRDQVAEITAGLTDSEDKIRAIYRFVADRTRYVGLEFGIHSYVPYQVSQVLQRRFGDCKDKSSLLVSMFREAGIPARMALLRMNRLGRVASTPASLAVFNHAVCYLPDQDLWLDGTAAFFDIRDLPPQDQETAALVIEEDGGRFTTTPVVPAERNRTEIAFDVRPGLDGNSHVHSEIGVQGSLAPDLRMRFLGQASPNELFEKTVNELFPGARVKSVKLTNLERPELPLLTTAEFEAPAVGRLDDRGLEVSTLGRDTSYQKIFTSLDHRRTDLLLGSPWSVHWSVRWTPPEGLQHGELPKGERVDSPFGWAECSFASDGGAAVVTAEFRITRSRVAAAEYAAFREFLSQVDRLLSKHLRLQRINHG